MSLYERLKAAGVPLDSHESDLYALATPEARTIVDTHTTDEGTPAYPGGVKSFVSNLDGKVWLEIPFAYLPWWEARQRPATS